MARGLNNASHFMVSGEMLSAPSVLLVHWQWVASQSGNGPAEMAPAQALKDVTSESERRGFWRVLS